MITEFYIYNDPDLRFLLEKKDNIELIRQKFEDELSNIFTDDGVIDFFEKWINKISNIKGILKNILIGVLVSICFAVVGNKLSDVNIIDKTSKEIVDDKIKDMSINQNYEFLNALAERESSNNWKASKGGFIKTKSGKLNKVDYVGKYQFGYYAFKDIGKEPIYHEDFKKNPNIYTESEQDKDMIKLLKKNKHYLRKYLYLIGKEIKGIKITESGLLAASHLVGNEKVKKFLETDGKIDYKDGNGVPCSSYLKKFAGYKIHL